MMRGRFYLVSSPFLTSISVVTKSSQIRYFFASFGVGSSIREHWISWSSGGF